jgi:hypothetical protein
MTSPISHNNVFISVLILLHDIGQTYVDYYLQNAVKPQMNFGLENYILK